VIAKHVSWQAVLAALQGPPSRSLLLGALRLSRRSSSRRPPTVPESAYTPQRRRRQLLGSTELFWRRVAVLDNRGDAWPDLLFVNGKDGSGGAPLDTGCFATTATARSEIFLAGSGLDAVHAYGLGAAIADYDNDGRTTVFMTTVDGGRLFHNEGMASSPHVTRARWYRNTEFAVSAAWARLRP